MNRDAGMETRDCPEERSLLKTHRVHGVLAKSCTKTGFTQTSRGTETVFFIDCFPNSPACFTTISCEPLRIQSEINVDTIRTPIRFHFTEIPLLVIMLLPTFQVIGNTLRDSTIYFIPKILVIIIIINIFITVLGFLCLL